MNIEEVKTIDDLKGAYLENFFEWNFEGYWDDDGHGEDFYVVECPSSEMWENAYSDERYFDVIYDDVDSDDIEASVDQIRSVLKDAMTCEQLPFKLPENVINIMLDEAERIVRSPEFKEKGFGDYDDILNSGLLIAFESLVCLKYNDEVYEKICEEVIKDINTPDYDPPEPPEYAWNEPWA